MNQYSLFDNSTDDEISFESAANLLGASTASIRNWVKAGYLTETYKGVISKISCEEFIKNTAGSTKLTSRANKSSKDVHNHSQLKDRILKSLDNNIDLATAGDTYENSLSDSYRNKEGIYYTPEYITDDFFANISTHKLNNSTFCDPCCGSGNFIMSALKHGIKPENVYGYDIDPIAVEITIQRIFDFTGFRSRNIYCVDYLNWSCTNTPCYDIIFTNPPWGKKLSLDEKKYYSKVYKAGSSTDTSSLFQFCCLRQLPKNGLLGLLLPAAFFNVGSFEDARRKALSLSIETLKDYGRAFTGLLTEAKGIIVRNSNCNSTSKAECISTASRHKRTIHSFSSNPKSIINFSINDQDTKTLDHLFNVTHFTLNNHAKWNMGIVTGNNKKFCINEPKAGYIPVYKGADIHKSFLRQPSIFIPEDLDLYQQSAPRESYLAPEKIIYRFISSNLTFYHDTNQVYVLNSANMLIPDTNLPLTAKQITDLINSDLMNWIFKSIFSTHKVLRSDIESLPIHYEYFNHFDNFDEDDYLNYLSVVKDSNGTYRIKK